MIIDCEKINKELRQINEKYSFFFIASDSTQFYISKESKTFIIPRTISSSIDFDADKIHDFFLDKMKIPNEKKNIEKVFKKEFNNFFADIFK